jgi:hypothetical protein
MRRQKVLGWIAASITRIQSPRNFLLNIFRNKAIFYDEDLLATRPASKLEAVSSIRNQEDAPSRNVKGPT